MAGVTISFTADSSGVTQETAKVTANLSAAFSGIQAQMKAMETASGAATSKIVTGLQQLAQQATGLPRSFGAVSQAFLQTGRAVATATTAFERLRQAQVGGESASAVMARGLTQLSQATIRLVAPQGDLGKVMLQTGKAAETQLSSFDKLRQQYLKTEDSSKGVLSSVNSLATAVKGLAVAAGINFSIQGLIALTKSIVEAGIANERLMLSLKGALGSAQAAGEAYQFVEQVANRLGIGLLAAGEGFAKLSAATQGTVVQGQQTRDLFVSISEASRVMGLSTSEVGGVMTALTQIIGKNTVSMEELRQQLGERLPSVLRLTAKEMGVTTSRFIEMVSKGEVLATDFIPAVTRAFQQMGQEAPAAAQSVQAALERLGNAWLALKVTIAQSGLLELVARIGEEMTRVINQTTNWINRTKRISGELGLAPMVAEMQRVTQEIQGWQEILKDPNIFAPLADQANTAVSALEKQRDALAEQIRVKQQVVEQDAKVRASAEALAAQDLKNAAAKEAEITVLKKASTAWTGISDDIKEVETSLKALRSFDVESLQALKIDPFAPDFEQKFNQAEVFFLKRLKDLRDKQAGVDKGAAARAVQEAGQSAVEIAKAREDALATSLKREESMIKQSADEQRRLVDEAASAELAAQGPSAVEAIAAKRLQDLRKITVEEAKLNEDARMANLAQDAKFRELRLQAEIAGAGKNRSVATKAQEELNNLAADTEAERVKIRAQTENTLQGISKKSVDDQITQARELNKIIKETEQDRLKARIDLVDEQINLIKAQVDGEVLTVEQGNAQIQALEEQRFANVRVLYEQQAQGEIDAINEVVLKTKEGTDERIAAEVFATEQIKKVREGLTAQLQAVNLQQQTQAQEHQNDLLKGWRDWVRDVRSALGDFLFRWMSGQVHSMKEVLLDLKSYFFRLIADMIAYAATKAIVIPIVTAVIGGIGGGGALGQAASAAGLLGQLVGAGGGGGGGGGGGLLDTGGTALTGLGLAKQLYSYLGLDSLTNYIGTGLSSLKETFLVGIDSLFKTSMSAASQAAAEAAELAATGSQAPGGGAAAVAGSQSGALLGIAGGLAAIGAGIYGALNASNNAAKAAYAASAAAGAAAAVSAAAVSGILGASAATAVGTGWTGVGLIVAAVMAVIGTVLNMVIKPAGPNLAVGQPAGVDVGVEGGKLVRGGGATSNIMREEGVSPEQTSGVQKSLNAGINAAVDSIIQTINAVALDPAKLLGPTQDALRFALSEVQTINSASARHMEKDIAEQLRFTNTAIVANMLEPINMAFEQLVDSDLKTQLERLPGTTMGLTDLFKQLNSQLDDMAKGENRDVLGQIQGVREAVERFGNRLAQTAGRTAEQIVNGVIDEFTTMTTTLPALHELSDAGQFSDNLGKFITALNEAMSGGLQALATLKKTQETLTAVGLSGEAVGTQVGRLITAIGEQSAQLSEQIVSMMTMTISELKGSADPGQFSQNLGTFITTLNTMVSGSLQALATLKATQQTLESFGLSGAAVGAQVGRLITMIGEQSAKLSEQIVIGSLKNLADALQTVVVQPIRIQATTVDSLFTDSLAALNELWLEMQRLDAVGIDTTRIKEQFTTLLGGVLESAKTLLTAAVQQSTFPEFLDVLLSIPDALAKLNPVFERLKALGQAFASVVGPNQQAIAQGEEQLRTPAERMAHTAEQMHDLELAIADAGTSAEKALPLYAQLGQAIQANAAAQIDAVQHVGAVIEQITSILDARGTTSDRLARVNQRINTAPGGGQGSIENISNLVTLYGQQLDLLAQLIDTIDAGLSSIDETLRADESVSIRAARLVGATAQPPEVPGKVRALTAEELLQQASALQDAISAVRELIDVIEQGLQNIQDILHANETINERATRLLTEVTTGPQPQTVEGLIQLSTGFGDALGSIRALIDLIEQGLQQIQDIMHANETATQRAIRLVAAVPSAQGVTDPAALITIAGQIGEAITAVRAVIDLLQSGIDSIDQTLFSLLSVAEQAANLQAKIAAINTEIATAGKATPEQLIKLVGLTQQALSVQQQITKSLEATLEDLKSSLRDAGPPIEQIGVVRSEIASLQQLAATGQATPEQLQKLVDLNQELLGLGREFDLLDVQQEALDSLKALAPIIQKQIDDSKLREQALVDNLVLIKTTLESYLTVAQSTEAQLLTQLAGIQTALQIALAVAVSTETWLITQLTVIQQWLEAALIGAKITEQQLVLQLLGVQAILQAQRAELAIAQAITIRYLDAQLAQLQSQLIAQYGTANVDLIIKQIQEWQLDELRDLNKRLKDLFFQQPQAIDLFGVQTAIGTQTTELQTGHLKSIDDQTGTVINKLDDIFKALDKPLVTVPKMQGGFIALQMGGPLDHASMNHAMTGPLHLARGGMVAAILEPGERVFPPPFTPSQTHALTAMNTEFPRMAGGGWTVPGSGEGDHVPAMLQTGSFVLNRRASGQVGYQGGGTVTSGESSTPVVHNHYYNFPNLTIRNKSDLEELKTLLRELERRRLQR